MGKVKHQAYKNSLSIYLGTGLGYLNIMVLFTNFFSQEQFGLIRLLLSVSSLLAVIALLSLPGIIIKYLHYFKDENKGNHGFLFFSLSVAIFGLLIVTGLFFIFKQQILHAYKKEASLFVENYFYLFPLLIFQVFHLVFASYLRAFFKTVLPLFLKEVGIRLVILLVIIGYIYNLYNFQIFTTFYCITYGLPIIILVYHIWSIGELYLKPDFAVFKSPLFKEIKSFGIYSILNRFSGQLNRRLDIIMLGAMTGLTSVSLYTIAFYLGELIRVSIRGLSFVSQPFIAEAFYKGDYVTIDRIYKKSSINQLLVGALVFVLIWINVEDILYIIQPKYLDAKNVTLFIGIAKLTQVSMGVKNQIIINSSYYRYNLLFMVFTAFFTIITNLIFIPLYGIMGAALATALSVLLNSIIVVSFIKYKMNMQPLSTNTLYILFIATTVFLVGNYLPDIYVGNLSLKIEKLLNTGYKSLVIILLYGLGTLYFKPSYDIHETLQTLKRKYLN